jgi:anaerobic ribonucleoside-triphosphate reductase
MTPHVMKRDGCKVPFKSERIKKQFCVQLKQRESMTQTIAPPSQKSLASKCRAVARLISTRFRPPLRTS